MCSETALIAACHARQTELVVPRVAVVGVAEGVAEQVVLEEVGVARRARRDDHVVGVDEVEPVPARDGDARLAAQWGGGVGAICAKIAPVARVRLRDGDEAAHLAEGHARVGRERGGVDLCGGLEAAEVRGVVYNVRERPLGGDFVLLTVEHCIKGRHRRWRRERLEVEARDLGRRAWCLV